MNKQGQLTVGAIVILFIGIVVAFALLTPIFDTQAQLTTKQVVTNQSNDVSSVYVGDNEVNETIELTIYTQSAWKQADCPLTSVVFRNGAGTALTAVTDYVLDADAGTYTLVNTTKTVPDTSLNLTYTDYTYCADGYNKDSGSRNMAALIGLFATFMLLGFVLEKSGVTNFTNIGN